MRIRSAEFLRSSAEVKSLPPESLPEYAFMGRSNVGKSSLINMLCSNQKLAKVSSAPGKTITINHFLVNKAWYLADFPGYGYARRAKEMRSQWTQFISEYISKRKNLATVFILIDISIPPQGKDIDFIDFTGSKNIPLVILLTKSDKVKRSGLQRNAEEFKAALSETWEELPLMVLTSSKEKTGREEILNYIEETNRVFAKRRNL
jgi:GTP-binding protein